MKLNIRRDCVDPKSYFVVSDNDIVARFRMNDSGSNTRYSVWMYKRGRLRTFDTLDETLSYIEVSWCRELAREIYQRKTG